jgi:hypothetical protein
MASTLNLQQTLLWTGPFLHYQPLTIGGTEPAVSNANLVKSTILGPPFTWASNRAESAPITLIPGTQDYLVNLPNFGFLEKAWVTLTTGVAPNTTTTTTEITVSRGLSKDSTSGRPDHIAVQLDDNAGNITFRLMPDPDQAYTLTVCFQQKALPMTSLASLWNPIGDELSYIFNFGFLAMSLILTGDARFPIFNDRFISHLLGAQDGLDEMQRNIFLGNYLEVMRQVQRNGMQTQQGVMGRAK